MIQIVQVREPGEVKLDRPSDPAMVERSVAPIIKGVRNKGDSALLRFARQFDGLANLPLRVSDDELESAAERMTPGVREAASVAIRNIREYAEAQLPKEFSSEFSPGRKLGWIVRPLEAVGCYVPSGRYPLPSTLLMTAVLAQAAGVKRICVVSPKPSTEILGCAHMLGIREVFRVGGAHAIAALAFGTKTIARVDRIAGPGNIYVAVAKKMLAGEVGIDFVAGPTEILILTETGDPRASRARNLCA